MTARTRALVVTLVTAMLAPTLQGTVSNAAPAVGDAVGDTSPDTRSLLVTTVGEFASVVRRDLGLWDTTLELTSHRFGGRFSEQQLDELRSDPRVGEVTLNGLVSNTATQTDGPNGRSLPWGLDRIDQRERTLSGSYTYTNDGTGVTVYVVDSGVRATHQEFAGGRVQAGWDYRSNPTALNSYLLAGGGAACGADSVNAAKADQGLSDQQGHGTHVSSTVVGVTVGVAKDARVIPVRALDCEGYGTYVMVEEALKWIVSHHTTGPAVVNLSLGVGPTDDDPDPLSTPIRDQISALVAEGVPVVIAAGNEAADSCSTMPIRYESTIAGVIGVAASGRNDEEAYFSNWGSCIDVFAPGVNIVSAYKTSNTAYEEISGTSMATPFVSGVIAQMLEANPSMTPAQVDAAVTANATRCAIARFADYPSFTPNRLVNSTGTAVSVSMPCAPVISGGSVDDRALTVRWVAPSDTGDSAITSYTVETTPKSDGCTVSATTTSCTVSELSAGQSYLVVVRATNAVGLSRPSAPATGTPTGTPDSPTLTGFAADLTSVTATWTSVLGDSNSYTVTAEPTGRTCVSTGTSCTIDGLSPGTTYSLTAVTTNEAGTSLASVALSATTADVPATPDTPTVTVGLNSVTLVWSAVARATSYRVKNGSGVVVCTTVETTCVVSGLEGGTTQSFTVEGVNSYGATSSQSVSATPDAQVSAVPGVKVKSANASLRVTWSVATGNDITYTVTALGTTSRCTTTSTSCTLPNLKNGRLYRVIVVGANASSQSASATAVSAYAGFTVKATKVKRSRRALLTSFVVPVSTGKRTWSETGPCRISGRYLVSPTKKSTCTLVLKTARTKRFPATSIKLRIAVS